MKTEIPSSEWNMLLDRWKGAKAIIWMYHTSHKKIAIRLEKSGQQEVVYLTGSGCRFFCGPFGWNDSIMSITTETGDALKHIVDVNARFELTCMEIGVFTAPASSFDESFEDWMNS